MLLSLFNKLFKKKPELNSVPITPIIDPLDNWEIIPIKRNRFQQTEMEDSSFSEPNLADLGFSQVDSLLQPIEDKQYIPKQVIHANSTDLIVFYVMAQPGQQFCGYELLQTLLAAGLRYGHMSIFHRYLEGSNTSLFSLASATEPGIFDIHNMGAFACSGLSLFMQTKNNPDPKQALQLMLETAKQLAEDLNGDLLNEQRQLLSEAIIDELALSVNSVTAVAYAE